MRIKESENNKLYKSNETCLMITKTATKRGLQVPLARPKISKIKIMQNKLEARKGMPPLSQKGRFSYISLGLVRAARVIHSGVG